MSFEVIRDVSGVLVAKYRTTQSVFFKCCISRNSYCISYDTTLPTNVEM